MKTRRLAPMILATLVLAATLTTPAAHAGRNCEARPPQATAVARGMDLADRTARALDASGAEVVVLARAGQDLSKYGLRWSHIGLAYKETSDTGVRWREGGMGPAVWREGARGPAVWRVVHKLNQCGSARGDLWRQGLGEFFLDDPWEYRAGFAVLAPEVQMKLHALLQENAGVQRLHEPDYNMLAYPWAQRYQQSNQWAVETLAMAVEPGATTRERAQAWLQFKGYQPTTLRLGAMTRLGARMTSAHIAFDDHPGDKRFSDRIETVTADSVFAWLERAALAGRMQIVH